MSKYLLSFKAPLKVRGFSQACKAIAKLLQSIQILYIRHREIQSDGSPDEILSICLAQENREIYP
jgi:hypothetical protein